MGLFDYVTDLYASLSVQAVEAEEPVADKSGEQSSGKDHTSGGIGSAQHDRGAAVRGGATTKTPAAAGQDENAEEAQANKQDATSDDDSGEKGHTPGEGGQKSGQLGTDYVNKASEEDAEEEEEEEEEPEDIKPKLEEGESTFVYIDNCCLSIVCSCYISGQHLREALQLQLSLNVISPEKECTNLFIQSVSSQLSARLRSTTTTSAPSASPSSKRRMARPMRTALRSVCCLTSFERWTRDTDRFTVFHMMHCATQCAAPKLFAALR